MKIMMDNNANVVEATLSVSRNIAQKISKKPTRLLIKTDSFPASDPTNLSPVVAQLNRVSLTTSKMPIFNLNPPLPADKQQHPKILLTPTDNLTPTEAVTANFVFSAPVAHHETIYHHPVVKKKRDSVPGVVTNKKDIYRLEDFKWIKTIGTGTFGRVVLCEHKTNTFREHPFYAMKMLRISDVFRLKQVEHIRDEKRILEKLNHPFIVRLFWSHHDSVNLYMLLEYAPGGELFSYLRSVGRFDSPTSMFYSAEIILALEYLHAKSIVYRDLKPENLIFDQEGHVKITDFGFAKELTDSHKVTTSVATSLVLAEELRPIIALCRLGRTWTLCGTPEYLAPEIIQSRGYNKAVDYWAYGILIYEMLAGHPPFFSDNPIEVYQKILDGKIRWPKHMDLIAKDLIRKLLVADRTKRLGNMKNGSDDIKAHRWFRSINWETCLNRGLQPPYVPEISHPGDTSNFDDYSESWMEEDRQEELGPSYKESLKVFDDFC